MTQAETKSWRYNAINLGETTWGFHSSFSGTRHNKGCYSSFPFLEFTLVSCCNGVETLKTIVYLTYTVKFKTFHQHGNFQGKFVF